MTSHALGRVLHLVLAAAATEAALVACGGAVDGVGNGASGGGSSSSSSSSSSGSISRGSSSRNDDGNDDDGWRPDGSVFDVAVDAPPDAIWDASTPDVIWTGGCTTGQIDPAAKYCCDASDPSCNLGSGNADAGQCNLDCKSVCNDVAPGSTGFLSCYWTTSSTTSSPKIQYYCGQCGVGRIPDGTAACARGESAADRLAMQSYYEAASVVAFRRLARVLAKSGAPASLVRRARRAAEDERRHARLFARLAEARGACVPKLRVAEHAPSLFEIALENAREGCVRETYGALVALHQSRHAADAELRAAFASIADDEIAHAALSWDLARWLDTKLSADERARVAAARAEAIATLREAAVAEHDAVDAGLGVPDPWVGRVLFDDLFARLDAAA